MKRLIATIAAGILVCVSGAAYAADKSYGSRHSRHNILLGVDTEFGIPLGNYADVNSVGIGAVLVGEYPLFDMLSATARVGCGEAGPRGPAFIPPAADELQLQELEKWQR